ncbi:MAG: four helix bundle protein [Verrucomicrobiae bacterium]|nr:four helix bundle protein [Verrucomicrobiae bacterium]
MNSNQTVPSGISKPVAMFDHEKLDVYHLGLQFIAWVTPLLEEVSRTAAGKTREVCDQLDRASLSTLLNTAEGNGKRQRQVRAKYFDDARGSATECAACLDALVAKNAASAGRVISGKQLLGRIVSMLCGLIDRFDAGSNLHDKDNGFELKQNTEPVTYLKSKSRTRTRTRTRMKE